LANRSKFRRWGLPPPRRMIPAIPLLCFSLSTPKKSFSTQDLLSSHGMHDRRRGPPLFSAPAPPISDRLIVSFISLTRRVSTLFCPDACSEAVFFLVSPALFESSFPYQSCYQAVSVQLCLFRLFLLADIAELPLDPFRLRMGYEGSLLGSPSSDPLFSLLLRCDANAGSCLAHQPCA